MRYSRLVAAAVSLLFVLPCAVQAGPLIIASSVVPGCNGSVATLTITLDPVTYNFYGNGLYYHFDPPSPGTQSGSSVNPAVVQIPPSFIASSSHILWISDSAAPTGGNSSDDYPFTVPACGPVSNCVSPPNTTMVAWYPFDEPAGPTAANLSTGNTGAHIGSPTPITGMVGGALNFDGIDDYVESPSTIVTNIGPAGLPSTCSGLGSTCRGDFSIDAWIRVDSSAPNSAITIFDKRGSSATSINGYSAYVYQQNRIGVQLADGGTGGGFTNYNSIVLNPPLIDGQWHHIAITVKRRGPGKIRFYHNGLLVGTPQSTTRWGSLVNNSPLRIGTRTAATPLTGWFQGDIDELEIFNRVLSSNEVNGIFKAGPSGKCKP